MLGFFIFSNYFAGGGGVCCVGAGAGEAGAGVCCCVAPFSPSGTAVPNGAVVFGLV